MAEDSRELSAALDAAIRRAGPRPIDIFEGLSQSALESAAYVLEQHALQQEVRALDEIREFLIAHPGVVFPDEQGQLVYTDDYLRFITGLAAPGQPGEGMSIEKLASVAGVPRATFMQWLLTLIP